MIKKQYIQLRTTDLSKNIIQKAAQSLGESMTAFIMRVVLEKSNEILTEHQNVSLSSKDQELFFDLIENPDQKTTKLTKAYKRFKNDLSC